MRKVNSNDLIKKIRALNNKAVLNADKIVSKSIKNIEEVQNCKSNYIKKMIGCIERSCLLTPVFCRVWYRIHIIVCVICLLCLFISLYPFHGLLVAQSMST